MTLTLISGIVVFVCVVLLFVFLILEAKRRLLPQGDVQIVVNGETNFTVKPGSSLLNTLADQGLLLASACGGGGTCAMCKCVVYEGGGEVLPTETNHLNRTQVANHIRLACQVKVKEDMKIHVPEEVFGVKKWECEVTSNYNVATFIKEFEVKLPEGEQLVFEAGGYIQIDIPKTTVEYKNIDITAHPKYHDSPDKFKADWDSFNLWKLKMENPDDVFRAYSMANHPAEGNIVKLTVRIATPPFDRDKKDWADVNPGIASSYIFNLKKGDKVNISGPYGEFFIEDTDREMLYVGGGAGMAPMRSHLFHLFHTLKTKRKVTFFYGGRTRKELFYINEFREIEKEFPNFRFAVALDNPLPSDNWTVKKDLDDPNGDGFIGFVHNVVIEQFLSKHPEPEELEVYFCGPPMMNASVLKMAEDWGIPDEQISFDDFGG